MKIFLILRSGGQYDDAYSLAEKAWSIRELAEQDCIRRYAEKKRICEAHEKFHEYGRQWDKDNPPTNMPPYPGQCVFPKWKNTHQQDISEYMRAERQALKDEHKKKMKLYSDLANERAVNKLKSCFEYITLLGFGDFVSTHETYFGTSYKVLKIYHDDEEYTIEEIDLD